ncbi:RNA recognition motif. (a.k.a. RRM, RBD, or RNP domain), putative [Angomonas deanei]|uniref:RNA recognition motif. (A.k.a. RRM, RBD, or RNP domain), putative n=1 Tax=Angomonas deanei TaxID=59799 RepID=A0A7G2C9B7_9TRYP|nr:RNA recognition motif. (a.k.a. RRM, RBD, or RNP domain), putative [Angomonas deanei]
MNTAYSRNVYIASLPPHYTNEQLYALFSVYGHILSHSVKTDRVTGLCKGYGFVMFAREEDAGNAVLALQSHYIDHTKVQVRLARPEASAKRVYPVVAQQQELQSALYQQQQQLAWLQYLTQVQSSLLQQQHTTTALAYDPSPESEVWKMTPEELSMYSDGPTSSSASSTAAPEARREVLPLPLLPLGL